MQNWNTVHIFGFGQSQVIGKNMNISASSDKLTTIAPLLQHLATKQKGMSTKMEDIRSINIINGMFVDVLPKRNGSEHQHTRLKYDTLDATLINALANEIAEKNENASEKTINVMEQMKEEMTQRKESMKAQQVAMEKKREQRMEEMNKRRQEREERMSKKNG